MIERNDWVFNSLASLQVSYNNFEETRSAEMRSLSVSYVKEKM